MAPAWHKLWAWVAVRAGLGAARLSRALGLGEGSIIGGRLTLWLCPGALSELVAGVAVVLVSGTNGKTTTSHLLAAALRTAGPVAHNATGSNMADGVVAALCAAPRARFAVLEVDELHLARVGAAVHPHVVVLLNLTRDQLDRAIEVRAIAATVGTALAQHPDMTVIANADDPMVVAAASHAERTVWVGAGSGWSADATTCPRCGCVLTVTAACPSAVTKSAGTARMWSCQCGLSRPNPDWELTDDGAITPVGPLALRLGLPGRFNLANALMAVAAGAQLGISPARSAAAMGELDTVAGRYMVHQHANHELRMLLAKNPAGWAETLGLLDEARPLLVVVNAYEADGRDTSWLWDVEFERLAGRAVVACGQRGADVGLRLSYADIAHQTVADPLAGLALLPAGKVDVVANYTAFHQLLRRLTTSATEPRRNRARSGTG